jgi:hypothetical protein
MFEQATRQKFRFESVKGLLSVEDLWDLPLSSNVGKASLDEVAKSIYQKVQSADNVSFVKKTTDVNAVEVMKLDIVKHIIAIRIKEQEEAATARENKAKKDRILAIMADKQDENLRNASLDDLKKMLESL